MWRYRFQTDEWPDLHRWRVYYSYSTDHIGVISRDFKTLTSVAKILVEGWQDHSEPGSRPIRLAIPEGPYLGLASKEGLAQCQSVVEDLCKAGFDIRNLRMFEDAKQQIDDLDILTYSELYRVHVELYLNYRASYKPTILAGIEIGKGVDVWICPSAPDVAPSGLAFTGDYRMNSVWSHTGHSVVTIPMGRNTLGLPYGLQIIGRFSQDESLIHTTRKVASMLGN